MHATVRLEHRRHELRDRSWCETGPVPGAERVERPGVVRGDTQRALRGRAFHIIDAKHGGNAARWINHACQPNCEADEIDGRIFIKALRTIKPGEELFYDYGLIIDEKYTARLKKQFACHCGAKKCRGTMLSPKR